MEKFIKKDDIKKYINDYHYNFGLQNCETCTIYQNMDNTIEDVIIEYGDLESVLDNYINCTKLNCPLNIKR
jgi:hypothetical protein